MFYVLLCRRLKYIVFIDILYMSELINETINKINKLYSNSGYMDKYGSDVWATAIMCIIFLLLTNYYFFANVLQVIKADWPNQKCNPAIMPFAGFINNDSKDQTNLEFTAINFNNCVNGFLKEIIEVTVQPLSYAVTILQDACNGIIDAFQHLRNLTMHLRNEFARIFSVLYSGIANLIITFIHFIVKMKDTLLKINGVLTTAFFTLVGSYMTAESLFNNITNFVLLLMIAIVLLVPTLWGTYAGMMASFILIPFAGPVAMVATVYTLAFLFILIPVIWFEVMLIKVMHLSPPDPPDTPSCFAGDTPVELFKDSNSDSNIDSDHKKVAMIKEIQIGDILKNGSTVTAIIKLSSEDQNMYWLHTIRVSGEHRVFHPTLKWIKVKDHPDSVPLEQFNEPYLYCLSTDLKDFTIGTTLFSDWDDIDANVLEDLNENCLAKGYLPTDFTLKDIHPHLESGFHPDSTLFLSTGQKVRIKDIQVNDMLLSGDKVLAVFKIAAHDIEQYNYSFTDDFRTLRASKNIHIDDPDLGVIHGLEYAISHPTNCIEVANELYMYHLLTDTKHFVVNTIRVKDYNAGIDTYLK
jgi:hypothetical protein